MFMIQIRHFASKTARKVMSEPKLHKKLVTFGSAHQVEAVYEDSMSNGSSIGTVIAFHGSPGSHKDFKYIRENLDKLGIRFIGINYPGFSVTPSYPNQDHGNPERQLFTDALIKKLDIPGKIVYMGHSRGCENALQTAVEHNADNVILLNSVGLRPHKAIRPTQRLKNVEKIYDNLPKVLGDPFILQLYKFVGFRPQNGEECISALRTMNRIMLDGQLPLIQKLNSSKTKVLLTHAGTDFLIESEIMFEALEKYENLVHFKFDGDPSEENNEEILKTLEKSDKGVSIFIKKDTHFQNKSRADLVAQAVKVMLSPAGKNKL